MLSLHISYVVIFLDSVEQLHGAAARMLWYGLHESRMEVHKAAQGLLIHWFKEVVGENVVLLVKAFNPEDNAGERGWCDT